jgi:hypothetical protein
VFSQIVGQIKRGVDIGAPDLTSGARKTRFVFDL